MSTPRIVMAGGGTAGHVNPLLATAVELRSRGADVIVLGTSEGLEADLVPRADFPFVTIPRAPFPRRPGKAMLSFPQRYLRAVRIATETIRGADAVVGFGGYVSTPAYRAAKKLGVPVIVHEQNARPGMANKVGAKSARVVALTFSSTPLTAANGQTQTIGLPLRQSIVQVARQRQGSHAQELRVVAAKRLGLDPDKTTVLITGGSLGAVHVNQVMSKAASFLPEGVQVLHLCGKGKAQEVSSAVQAAGVADRWHIREYLLEMEDAFSVADLVVARSGAGTVAELTALGLPAVYVPLPIGNGEQRLNAQEHVNAGGAKIIADAEFTEEYVRQEIWSLFEGPKGSETLKEMARLSAGIGHIDASEVLAELVYATMEAQK